MGPHLWYLTDQEIADLVTAARRVVSVTDFAHPSTHPAGADDRTLSARLEVLLDRIDPPDLSTPTVDELPERQR